MAKDKSVDPAPTENQTNGAAPTAPPVSAPAPTVASNVIMVTDPQTGQSMRRTDYIRKCWTEYRWSRGQIAKHLSELNEKNGVKDPKDPTKPLKVPYQAVFAVLKKGAESYGGPIPAAAGGAAPQPPAIQAGAAPSDQQA
jgi:hypothetical protein